MASRPPRNPRRAYDENGNEIPPVTVGRSKADAYDADANEIPPVTVGQSKANGEKTVMAYCEAQGCGHEAIIRPNATPVPDMALRLRCSNCASKRIKMMMNVTEMYSKAHGVGYGIKREP